MSGAPASVGMAARTPVRRVEYMSAYFLAFAQRIVQKHAIIGDYPWNDAQLVLLEQLKAQEERMGERREAVTLTLNLMRMYITQMPDSISLRPERSPQERAAVSEVRSSAAAQPHDSSASQESSSAAVWEEGAAALREIASDSGSTGGAQRREAAEQELLRAQRQQVLNLRRSMELNLHLLSGTPEGVRFAQLLRKVMDSAGEAQRAAVAAVESYVTEAALIPQGFATSEQVLRLTEQAASGSLAVIERLTPAQRPHAGVIRPHALSGTYRRIIGELGRRKQLPTAQELFAAAVQRQQQAYYGDFIAGFLAERTELRIAELLGRPLLTKERSSIRELIFGMEAAEMTLLTRNENALDYGSVLQRVELCGAALEAELDETQTENRQAMTVLHQAYTRLAEELRREIAADNIPSAAAEGSESLAAELSPEKLWTVVREQVPQQFLLFRQSLAEASVMVQTAQTGREMKGTSEQVVAADAPAANQAAPSMWVLRTQGEGEAAAAALALEIFRRLDGYGGGAAALAAAERRFERLRQTSHELATLRAAPERLFTAAADELLHILQTDSVLERIAQNAASAAEESAGQLDARTLVLERWNGLTTERRELIFAQLLGAAERSSDDASAPSPERRNADRERDAETWVYTAGEVLAQLRQPQTADRSRRLAEVQAGITPEGLRNGAVEAAVQRDFTGYTAPVLVNAATRSGTAAVQQAHLIEAHLIEAQVRRESIEHTEMRAAVTELAQEITLRQQISLRKEPWEAEAKIVYAQASQSAAAAAGTESPEQAERKFEQLEAMISQQERSVNMSRTQIEQLQSKLEWQEKQREEKLRQEALRRMSQGGRQTGLPREIANELKTQLRIERLRHGTD